MDDLKRHYRAMVDDEVGAAAPFDAGAAARARLDGARRKSFGPLTALSVAAAAGVAFALLRVAPAAPDEDVRVVVNEAGAPAADAIVVDVRVVRGPT